HSIIRPFLTFPHSPGGLVATNCQKLYALAGSESSRSPLSKAVLFPVIVRKKFIVLKLCLDIRKKITSIRVIFTHQDHTSELPMSNQPRRDNSGSMNRLCVLTWPFENTRHVRVI